MSKPPLEFLSVSTASAVEYGRSRLTLIFDDWHGFYISYRDPDEGTSDGGWDF